LGFLVRAKAKLAGTNIEGNIAVKQGFQGWPQIGSDWPQMGQIQNLARQAKIY